MVAREERANEGGCGGGRGGGGGGVGVLRAAPPARAARSRAGPASARRAHFHQHCVWSE